MLDFRENYKRSPSNQKVLITLLPIGSSFHYFSNGLLFFPIKRCHKIDNLNLNSNIKSGKKHTQGFKTFGFLIIILKSLLCPQKNI